jgi:hypothetical protein
MTPRHPCALCGYPVDIWRDVHAGCIKEKRNAIAAFLPQRKEAATMYRNYPPNLTGWELEIVGDDKPTIFDKCPRTDTGNHQYAVCTTLHTGVLVRVGVNCSACGAYDDMPASKMFRAMLAALAGDNE